MVERTHLDANRTTVVITEIRETAFVDNTGEGSPLPNSIGPAGSKKEVLEHSRRLGAIALGDFVSFLLLGIIKGIMPSLF